jgi:hypothetical protein
VLAAEYQTALPDAKLIAGEMERARLEFEERQRRQCKAKDTSY